MNTATFEERVARYMQMGHSRESAQAAAKRMEHQLALATKPRSAPSEEAMPTPERVAHVEETAEPDLSSVPLTTATSSDTSGVEPVGDEHRARVSPWIFIHSHLDDSDLRPSEFRVLCHIARRQSGPQRTCFAKLRSMADDCGLSIATVRAALALLVEHGWVIRHPRPGNRDGDVFTLATTPPTPAKKHKGSEKTGGLKETGSPTNSSAEPLQLFGAHPSQNVTPKDILIRKSNKDAGGAAPASIPPVLDTPAFRAALGDWFAYRSENKLKPWKPITVTAKLKELAAWGEPAAIASIRQSISNGWQGLFAPKNGSPETSVSTNWNTNPLYR